MVHRNTSTPTLFLVQHLRYKIYIRENEFRIYGVKLFQYVRRQHLVIFFAVNKCFNDRITLNTFIIWVSTINYDCNSFNSGIYPRRHALIELFKPVTWPELTKLIANSQNNWINLKKKNRKKHEIKKKITYKLYVILYSIHTTKSTQQNRLVV